MAFNYIHYLVLQDLLELMPISPWKV